MYRVALCEDEKIFAEEQEKTCQSILDNLNIEYCINVFDNSVDFIATFSKGQAQYDLILLDIIMDGTDGIKLAQLIRETDKEATIIFITCSRDYALQGYDVNALHYLVKPLNAAHLERLIMSDYNKRFVNPFFVFESGSSKQRVSMKDIICLETAGRRVEVTLWDRTVYHSGKLTELLKMLPNGQFVRCHQAFAINIQNIRELTRKDAVATNGKKIPVSRTFTKDVQRVFLKQLRDE